MEIDDFPLPHATPCDLDRRKRDIKTKRICPISRGFPLSLCIFFQRKNYVRGSIKRLVRADSPNKQCRGAPRSARKWLRAPMCQNRPRMRFWHMGALSHFLALKQGQGKLTHPGGVGKFKALKQGQGNLPSQVGWVSSRPSNRVPLWYPFHLYEFQERCIPRGTLYSSRNAAFLEECSVPR